jgi:predicted MFS family arabinose efflux permease
VSGLLAVSAVFTMPSLGAHVARGRGHSMWSGVAAVLADANHRWGFLFSLTMMSAGFMVIPYITLYMQSNAGVPAADVPYIYLFGGLATLASARYFGRLTDGKGKQPTFALLAVLLCGPLLALTVLPPWPLPALIGVSTALFVVSRRPGNSWHVHGPECGRSVGCHGAGRHGGRASQFP